MEFARCAGAAIEKFFGICACKIVSLVLFPLCYSVDLRGQESSLILAVVWRSARSSAYHLGHRAGEDLVALFTLFRSRLPGLPLRVDILLLFFTITQVDCYLVDPSDALIVLG